MSAPAPTTLVGTAFGTSRDSLRIQFIGGVHSYSWDQVDRLEVSLGTKHATWMWIRRGMIGGGLGGLATGAATPFVMCWLWEAALESDFDCSPNRWYYGHVLRSTAKGAALGAVGGALMSVANKREAWRRVSLEFDAVGAAGGSRVHLGARIRFR